MATRSPNRNFSSRYRAHEHATSPPLPRAILETPQARRHRSVPNGEIHGIDDPIRAGLDVRNQQGSMTIFNLLITRPNFGGSADGRQASERAGFGKQGHACAMGLNVIAVRVRLVPLGGAWGSSRNVAVPAAVSKFANNLRIKCRGRHLITPAQLTPPDITMMERRPVGPWETGLRPTGIIPRFPVLLDTVPTAL